MRGGTRYSGRRHWTSGCGLDVEWQVGGLGLQQTGLATGIIIYKSDDMTEFVMNENNVKKPYYSKTINYDLVLKHTIHKEYTSISSINSLNFKFLRLAIKTLQTQTLHRRNVFRNSEYHRSGKYVT